MAESAQAQEIQTGLTDGFDRRKGGAPAFPLMRERIIINMNNYAYYREKGIFDMPRHCATLPLGAF